MNRMGARQLRGILVIVLAVATSSVFGNRPAFPVAGLLPKADIGADRFLEKHPEFDGRGTVVAILDTGVDPGAAGLQTTTDGKPKIIDIIDATGSGDVDMSTVRKPADGKLEGLTGRMLKLPDITSRDGQFRVGMKAAWHLFPGELIDRVKKVRREKWSESHRETVFKVQQELTADGRDREELQARLDVLKTLEETYDDPGPVYDCVVFNDGTAWRAIIDTDEDGDLADEKLLTDFDRERQWATFSSEDRLNFGVHIYDEGKTLSIVTDSGSHGTHVAGIVAGHYPEHPERNGIAPGAQLVAIKIGDTRLDSMETGSALLRATTAIVRHKCDLANMSYGEPTSRPSQGLIVSALGELGLKHNVLFLSSAMNSGPALTTVGAPGGTTEGIIGVGASLSPEMMAAQYSHREALPLTAYTFTSRGPARDGDLGVAIFAPGGAVAPVPQWTLHRSLQMNGTSMASPNACGGVALLVSALKAEKLSYNPASVRRALQNTARPVEGVEVFAQGPGLLQVDRAWEYLKAHSADPAEHVRFEVSIHGRPNSRGLYLRDPGETDRPQTFFVSVEPRFPEDPTHQNELNFDVLLTLESTASWVDVGPALQLTSAGRSFEIRVDPTKVEPGAHFAEIRGLLASDTARGPLFRVPVTLLRPINLPSRASAGPSHRLSSESGFHFKDTMSLTPGELVRHFHAVPPSAISATLELKRVDEQAALPEPVRIRVDAAFAPEDGRFDVHTVSAALGKSHSETFPVTGGELLELCFVRDWRSLAGWSDRSREPTTFDYELRFHSVLPSMTSIPLPAEGPAVDVRLTAGLGRESLSPSASLSTRRQLVRPTRATLKPAESDRDVLPKGKRLNVLTLEYSIKQPSSGRVTPRFPLIDDLLYDSDYGTMLWMLFDAGGKLVASNDIYADSVSLEKGTYTLRLQMKHPDAERLEELRTLWMALDRAVSISLPIARERPSKPGHGALLGSPTLEAGESTTAWIVPPESFGGASAGEILLGTVRWTADGPTYPVRTVVPGSATSSKEDEDSLPMRALAGEKPDDAAGRIARETLECRLNSLLSLKSGEREAFEKLVAELEMQHPGQLVAPYVRLRWLDDADQREHRLPEILSATQDVLSRIDSRAIQLHFGANVPPDDSAAKRERERMTELRKVLIDTLYRRGRALGYQELPEVVAKQPIPDPAAHDRQFEETFAELRRWVDTTDREYFLLHVRRDRRKDRPGQALKLLLKHADDLPLERDYAEKRRDLIKDLGWTHQLELEERRLMRQFPKHPEPF